MSQKERRRVGIMTSVKAGELSLVEVSEVLGLSCRQAKRMWQRYRSDRDAGDGGLAVKPASKLPTALAAKLRSHKSEIITLLALRRGWQSIPPLNLALVMLKPNPTPANRDLIVAYLARQCALGNAELRAWLSHRRASFWRGTPFDCLAAWAQGRCAAVVSPALLAEYHETLEELRLDYLKIKPVEWVAALTESSELVFPTDRATGATPNPADEMVLECALAGEADYIVSGDKKHLLPLREFQGIRIVSPAEFCRLASLR